MKTKNIYVGANGATLALTSGRAVAALPPKKGDNVSYMLMESGQVAKVNGSRVNGVGVARFLKENGFELAQADDPRASRLADHVDCREGTSLVEDASKQQALQLQKQFGGKPCVFVPFDSQEPSEVVKVEEPRGSLTMMFDLVTGFNSGTVSVDFNLKSKLGSSLGLHKGWFVDISTDASLLPRNSDYGGLVERAAFTICNCGLASIVGAQNLVMPEDPAEDDPHPRGKLDLALTNGDAIVVGITACDELEVVYRRDGAALYSRTCRIEPRLGEVIGAIAAVLVRIRELDAAAVKKTRKKAA